MAPEELVAAIRRRPFVPFRVTLTEGTTHEIRHPELCMAGRRSAVIGLVGPDARDPLFDRSVTVDLLHIVQIEPLGSAVPPGTSTPA
jgi:hypothetical protein